MKTIHLTQITIFDIIDCKIEGHEFYIATPYLKSGHQHVKSRFLVIESYANRTGWRNGLGWSKQFQKLIELIHVDRNMDQIVLATSLQQCIQIAGKDCWWYILPLEIIRKFSRTQYIFRESYHDWTFDCSCWQSHANQIEVKTESWIEFVSHLNRGGMCKTTTHSRFRCPNYPFVSCGLGDHTGAT